VRPQRKALIDIEQRISLLCDERAELIEGPEGGRVGAADVEVVEDGGGEQTLAGAERLFVEGLHRQRKGEGREHIALANTLLGEQRTRVGVVAVEDVQLRRLAVRPLDEARDGLGLGAVVDRLDDGSATAGVEGVGEVNGDEDAVVGELEGRLVAVDGALTAGTGQTQLNALEEFGDAHLLQGGGGGQAVPGVTHGDGPHAVSGISCRDVGGARLLLLIARYTFGAGDEAAGEKGCLGFTDEVATDDHLHD